MPIDPARLKAVFSEAIARPDPTERAAYLDAACAADSELRSRVEALLRASADPDSVLDATNPVPPPTPVNYDSSVPDGFSTSHPPDPDRHNVIVPGGFAGVSPRGAPAPAVGTLIAGRYKLLQQIGEGGMGAVWTADQTEPVKRRVAVKLIRADRANSRTILTRFEAERQAIALMDHPHIAKLLDAGTAYGGAWAADGEESASSPPPVRSPLPAPQGTPFFVMELVRGVPLTEFCDAHRLSVPDRLRLFVQVCQAVQHAHQKGIIHRDLKPGNVLVENHDRGPLPKVIDFGLAKAAGGLHLTEHTLFTMFGSVMGTPLYMAPEQAAFDATDVDTRADVYALGAILYELLTGSTPLTRDVLKQAAPDEMLRLIREQEPPAPSSRIGASAPGSTVGSDRRMEPAKLARFVKGELDWIALKALSKERDRRYETANGFAADIERFLNHEPVQAGPPTARYQLQKFVRRNRGAVTAAGLVFLALVAGVIGTTLGLIEARQQTDEKERALEAETAQRLLAQAETVAKEGALQAESQALARAVVKEREAMTAKEQEAEERAKAEGAYAKTADVLDAMTSAITGDSLATQMALSAEQKKFLTEVLKYYQEFAAVRGADEQARGRTAHAAYRVGLIEYRLGRKEEAAAALRTARDTFEKLASDSPGVPTNRFLLAANHSNLGMVLAGLGRRAEAQEQYTKALAILEKLTTEFPRVPDYRQALALSHTNLSVPLIDLGKRGEAEDHQQKALAIQEKLAHEFADAPQYRKELGSSYHNLGLGLVGQGRPGAAQEQFTKALVIQEKLADEFPDVPQYQQSLAESYNNRANLLKDLGNRAGAWEHHKKALAIRERLAAGFPNVAEYRQDLSRSHYNLGNLLSSTDADFGTARGEVS